MDLFKQMLVLGSIGVASLSFGQISSGKVEEPKPEVDTPRVKRTPTEGLNEFSFYLGAGRVFSNRVLTENAFPFGAPLGLRADETGLKSWSFQVGVRNRFAQWFSYDAGLSIDRTGESYSYDDPETDSTYSYTTRYTYYALPLQVFVTYGKDLRFFAGGGIQPQLFAGYRQEQQWTTSKNGEDKATITADKGMNSFTMAAIASAGVQLRFGPRVSIYLLPTMLWNLTSTYDDQSDYIHKARTFNLKFGLVFHFPQ